jgi:hypothetical protein
MSDAGRTTLAKIGAIDFLDHQQRCHVERTGNRITSLAIGAEVVSQ